MLPILFQLSFYLSFCGGIFQVPATEDQTQRMSNIFIYLNPVVSSGYQATSQLRCLLFCIVWSMFVVGVLCLPTQVHLWVCLALCYGRLISLDCRTGYTCPLAFRWPWQWKGLVQTIGREWWSWFLSSWDLSALHKATAAVWFHISSIFLLLIFKFRASSDLCFTVYFCFSFTLPLS